MTHWVLYVAPLVVASLVMVLAFVGCSFHGAAVTDTTPDDYKNELLSQASLVSYWRLDEQQGDTVAHDSKGPFDGFYAGGVTLGTISGLVMNVNDTAAEFDGSSAYVHRSYRPELNPPHFTVEALVKLDGGDNQFRAVVSSRDIQAGNAFGYILYASDQNVWEAWVGDGTTAFKRVPGGAVMNGITTFLAMTYDGTTLRLYVNPADVTPYAAALSYQPNTNRELRIGAGANEAAAPQYFFPGVIDEVAVYNEALPHETLQLHTMMALGGMKP